MKLQHIALGAATLASVILLLQVPARASTIPGTTLTPSVWLDADQIPLIEGSAVGSWPDASGNGRTATQNTALRQPFFHTGVANGHSVVRFNLELQPGGTANQFLAFPTALANTDTSQLSLYVVAFDSGTRSAANGRATLVNTRQNAGTPNGFLFGYASDPLTADYAHVSRTVVSGGSGNLQFNSMGATGFNLLTLTRDGLTSTLADYTDVDATSGTATWSGFTISTLSTTQIGTEGGSHYLFGDIAEIVAFDGFILSPEEHAQVVRYLGEKYNVVSAIPEPSSAVMFVLAGSLLARRQRPTDRASQA